MEKRHSSPSPGMLKARPKTHRKRSNSFPIVEALGCSTQEAELILAEGRAAICSRQASKERRGRRRRSLKEETAFRPRDHLKYLNVDSAVEGDVNEETMSPWNTRSSRHSRIPSNATDGSTSTVIAPVQPQSEEAHHPDATLGSPLGNYSHNLAEFIRSQLSSIPSYRPSQTSISPRSCPDLMFQSRSPPQSPPTSIRRPAGAPKVIGIPPVRPPLRSAFSAWSSTDDETDDEVLPLPDIEAPRKDSKASQSNSTPSILGYYEHSNDSSLFSSTPLEEDGDEPDTAKGCSFPNSSALQSTSEPHWPAHHDYPSSSLSTRPQLTASSAPSISSTSTASYFDCKRPISVAPHVRDRIIAAVTPQHGNGKILPAISPFEDGALSNVHDILVESQQRVHVDGMSFDMMGGFSIPPGGVRVTTPC